jgi:hypothetical protein
MSTLTDRDVPRRLGVVYSDGSPEMEAVVAALLNIPVGGDTKRIKCCKPRYKRK